jgi:hypothetical protein
MTFNLFKRKNNVSLKKFLTQLKRGERDFHSVLGTLPGDFKEATFEQLMSNEDDVLAGINRVQTNLNITYFDLFGSCLIKHNDAGDIEYIFYTTTDNAHKVIEIANLLFEELGDGIFDNN